MNTVKLPKKPVLPKFLGFGICYSRYKNRCDKWYSLLPKNGDLIQLVELPNPINNPSIKSCYIGEIGVVELLIDGNFALHTGTSEIIVNSQRGLVYKKITPPPVG